MFGLGVRVPTSHVNVFHPEFNVNGTDTSRIWVITRDECTDRAAYIRTPADVTTLNLTHYQQIDIPDGPDALPTIVAVLHKAAAEAAALIHLSPSAFTVV